MINDFIIKTPEDLSAVVNYFLEEMSISHINKFDGEIISLEFKYKEGKE